MKRNRLASFGSALVLSLSSLLVFSAPRVFAATTTWSGGGSDTNVSTAANWVGGVAPVNGDILVFPNVDSMSVTNDSLTSVGGITLQDYTGSSLASAVSITGNFTLNGDLAVGAKRTLDLPTVTLGANSSFILNDKISSRIDFVNSGLIMGANNLIVQYPNWQNKTNTDGSIYISELQFNNATITSAANSTITVNGAKLSLNIASPGLNSQITLNKAILDVNNPADLGSASVIQNSSQLKVGDVSSSVTKVFSQSFTFNGNLYGASWKDNYLIGLESISTVGTFDVTFSGPVALSKDTAVAFSSTAGGRTFTVNGPLSGTGLLGLGSYDPNFSFKVASSANTSSIPNGDYQVITTPTTLSDSLPAKDVIVVSGNKLILTGKRNTVIVSSGGNLFGTGTAGAVLAQSSATVDPGQSPGCLSTGNFTLAGTLDQELGGTTACTEYDQLNVTGTVTLSGSTLNATLYNGFKPVAGQIYTIISNDGSDAVTGTFNGLAEGATFTVGGYVLKVSYKGGDGNDVTLSVQSIPSTPNTGISLITSHPIYTFLVTSFMAAGIALIARRHRTVLVRK